jgi:hypothetical protein
VRTHEITRLIPTGEEVLYVARGRNRLSELCEVLCDEPQILETLHDKLRFQELTAAVGPVPMTSSVENAEQLASLIRAHGPLILKQVHSRFGRGVRLIREPCELPPGRWLAQQYIRGREICGQAIARRGRLIALVCYEPRFRLPLGPGYCFVPVAHTGVEAWVRTFVTRYNLTGAVAFDFIESEDGVLYPLECNPRLTSGVHLFPRDCLAAAILAQRDCFPQPQRSAMFGAAMLALGLPAVHTFAELRAWARAFASSRDVFWDRADPRPALHMFSSHRHLRSLRKKHGISFASAATFYTEWNA